MQQTGNETRKSDGQNNILPFIPEGNFCFTKGVESFQKHKFQTALKWLQKAVEQEPDEPLFQCQMSIVYTEIGEYHTANQLLNDVLQLTEDDYPDCYYLLANNYAHLGLLQDAKKYALSYLDNEPDGDFSDEVRQLLELVDIDEDDDINIEKEDELLIYQESLFYHMENLEWKKALPLVEEMVSLFPEHRPCHHDYARVLFHNGFPEKAIQLELELLESEPSSFVSRANLAIFYDAQDQPEEGQKYVQSIQNVYPVQEQQKLRLAVTFAMIGLYDEANHRFRLLSKSVVKSHPSYYRWYSISMYMEGAQEKALDLWKEGCRQHPNLVHEKPWD